MWYRMSDDGSRISASPCPQTVRAFSPLTVAYRDLIYNEPRGDTYVEVCRPGDDIGEHWYVLDGHALTGEGAVEYLLRQGFSLPDAYRYLDAI